MPKIEKTIKQKLKDIEKSYDVKILYACESGSRAWGFESSDSDYDVRFIYAHRKDWYLDIFEKRDVIELDIEDELDINGWELKKALKLLNKSNPALFEWINSPIVYKKHNCFNGEFKELATKYYNQKSCFYHYLNMAKKNYRGYLKGDEVWVKKYFYVLRPILACLWIEKDFGIVPTEFEKLLVVLKVGELKVTIQNLVEEKKQGFEKTYVKKIDILDSFIQNELERLAKLELKNNAIETNRDLNDFFVKYIKKGKKC